MKDDLKNKKGKEIPNPDDFWPEAKELLDKHYAAKRRILIFWRWTFVLLSLSTISYFAINYSNNAISNSNSSNTNTVIKSPNYTATQTLSNKIEENQTKSITESSTSNIPNEDIVITPPSANAKKENNQVTKKSIKNKAPIATVNSGNTSRGINQNTTIVANNTILTKENSSVVDELPSSSSTTINAEPENSALTTTNKSKPSEIQMNRKVTELAQLLRLSYVKVSPSYEKDFVKPLNIDNKSLTSEEYAKMVKKITYSISVYSGLQSIQKKLQPSNQFQEYAARRSNEETNAMTAFHGLELQLKRKNLLLNTGFQYNTLSENINYKALSKQWQVSDLSKWNSFTKQVLVVDTFYYFGIKSFKTTTKTIADSSFQEQYDSSFVNASNPKILAANGRSKFSYLEIPLSIGYQFKLMKLTVAPIAGVSFGYLSRKEGYYLNKSLTDIENISAINEIRNYMINYSFQLQIGYAINRRIGIFIAPQYKANALSLTIKSFGVDTYYKSFGGLLGMKFEL